MKFSTPLHTVSAEAFPFCISLTVLRSHACYLGLWRVFLVFTHKNLLGKNSCKTDPTLVAWENSRLVAPTSHSLQGIPARTIGYTNIKIILAFQ